MDQYNTFVTYMTYAPVSSGLYGLTHIRLNILHRVTMYYSFLIRQVSHKFKPRKTKQFNAIIPSKFRLLIEDTY